MLSLFHQTYIGWLLCHLLGMGYKQVNKHMDFFGLAEVYRQDQSGVNSIEDQFNFNFNYKPRLLFYAITFKGLLTVTVG